MPKTVVNFCSSILRAVVESFRERKRGALGEVVVVGMHRYLRQGSTAFLDEAEDSR